MEDWNPQDDKNLEEAMRRSKMKSMLSDLKNLEGGLPELEPIEDSGPIEAKQRKFRPWLIAAGILLLLSAGWFIFSESQSDKYQELFAAHFEPYPAMEQTRGGTEDLKTRAYEAYAAEDFELANVLLEELNSLEQFAGMTDVLGEQAQLYIILGHLYKGDVEWLRTVKPEEGEERIKELLEEVLRE